ncbi:hypothetical protein B0H14DRAFT_2577194 [Mycena olivaceomarginata]|nr:hypothetical protein B0H14DRAFT_2577194 [Mycena olivaceomarginata]
MPKNKWSSKAKNLGVFAVKCKPAGPLDRTTTPPTSPKQSGPTWAVIHTILRAKTTMKSKFRRRTTYHIPGDHADLLSWLQISDTHLNSLHTSAATACCGSYHSSKIGKQLLISDFFTCPQTIPVSRPLSLETDPETEYSSDSDLPPVEDMDPDPSYSFLDKDVSLQINQPSLATPLQGTTPQPESTIPPTSRMTIEDLEDDEDDYLAVQPSQLSPEARTEEGLDDLPWDPAKETLPRSPAPPPSPGRSLPPGTASYFHHERGFTMPNRPAAPGNS